MLHDDAVGSDENHTQSISTSSVDKSQQPPTTHTYIYKVIILCPVLLYVMYTF